jgi:drug/metabolite transporter (DMT)-like permease
MTGARGRWAGLGLALLSAVSFSTAGSFARPLTEAGWSAGAAVAVRIAIAALVLAVPAALAMRGRWRALRGNLRMIAVYGLVAVAGCQVAFFYAIQYLSVGVALLLEYLGAVLVVLWLWLRHRQRPRRLTLAGTVLALLGLVCVLDLTNGAQVHWVGVLWGLAAAVGLAVYFVLSARGDSGLPPVAVAGAGMWVGTAALLTLGALGAVPMQASFGAVEFAGVSTHWLVPVLGLGLIAAAVAYSTGIGAARLLGAKLASFVGLTEVAFAVLVAWLVLSELPTLIQLFGGVLIVGGVVVVRLDELRGGSEQSLGGVGEGGQRLGDPPGAAVAGADRVGDGTQLAEADAGAGGGAGHPEAFHGLSDGLRVGAAQGGGPRGGAGDGGDGEHIADHRVG